MMSYPLKAGPQGGYTSLASVRDGMLVFEGAYSERHLHSGIWFVLSAVRHGGIDHECLAYRKIDFSKSKAPKSTEMYWHTPELKCHRTGIAQSWEIAGY